MISISFIPTLFQSALPRGERPDCTPGTESSRNFNPRSREGSDDRLIYFPLASIFISIRAPARGATFYKTGIGQDVRISIRAPARGATLVILGLPTKPHISIRAPARGATILCRVFGKRFDISIRAPARGATLRS